MGYEVGCGKREECYKERVCGRVSVGGTRGWVGGWMGAEKERTKEREIEREREKRVEAMHIVPQAIYPFGPSAVPFFLTSSRFILFAIVLFFLGSFPSESSD